MGAAIPAREGFVSFHGHNVWHRIVGGREESGKLPLLCLHGGPGAPHDYLEPLEAMAATGRRVIFYDQLGCGNSDQPHNPSMWSVDLFVEEVGVVRRALGLERVHILGQSWGGMLALEYALTQPSGLASLVVADSPASMPQWVSEANRLRAELPPEVQQALLEHETAGTVDSPEYQEAMMVSIAVMSAASTLGCRIRRPQAFEKLGRNPEVYHTMIGPSRHPPRHRHTQKSGRTVLVSRLG